MEIQTFVRLVAESQPLPVTYLRRLRLYICITFIYPQCQLSEHHAVDQFFIIYIYITIIFSLSANCAPTMHAVDQFIKERLLHISAWTFLRAVSLLRNVHNIDCNIRQLSNISIVIIYIFLHSKYTTACVLACKICIQVCKQSDMYVGIFYVCYYMNLFRNCSTRIKILISDIHCFK